MKKQELIHLHGLLAEVRNRYERRSSDPVNCADYEATGVRPTSIHRSKTDHRDAVFKLAGSLTDAMAVEEKLTSPIN
ncbi:UPF0058 family protein [Haladaptatus sp. NG-SE-30]